MKRRELTGFDVLYWLVLSFGVVIAVNVYFIVISVKTFRGEDEQKPYLQGMEYNQTLAERVKQAELGWTATIGAQRLANGHVRIAIDLKQPDGAPQTHVKLSGEMRHPADETRDKSISLREAGAGEYVGEISGVASGAWDVIVTAPQRSATPFEATRRLWLP
jgi:nitrogen fixation protein FixH